MSRDATSASDCAAQSNYSRQSNHSRRDALHVFGAAIGASLCSQPSVLGMLASREEDESASSSAQKFKAKLDDIRLQAKLPGLMAGYVKKNGDSRVESCGVRKSSESQLLTKNDPMHLGSCTKSMTATLVAMLIEEGKLRWDSRLGDLCHGVQSNDSTKGELNADSASIKTLDNSAWADITVEQIMEHSAGLPANAPWGFWLDRPDLIKSREEVAGWLLSQSAPPKLPTDYLYSNVGYMLLGHFLERIENKPWETIIRERIFQPLEMKSADFGSPASHFPSDSPWGHIPSGPRNQPQSNASAGTIENGDIATGDIATGDIAKQWRPTDSDNPPVLGPAGTVHASMLDWAKYLQIHLLDPDDVRFPLKISKQNWDRLHQPKISQNYAGGWIVSERKWAEGEVYFHNGSNTMWYCITFVAPKKGVAIFGASNCGLEAAGAVDQALQLVIADWL